VKAKAEDAISAVRRSILDDRVPPLLKEKTVVPLFFGDARSCEGYAVGHLDMGADPDQQQKVIPHCVGNG